LKFSLHYLGAELGESEQGQREFAEWQAAQGTKSPQANQKEIGRKTA